MLDVMGWEAKGKILICISPKGKGIQRAESSRSDGENDGNRGGGKRKGPRWRSEYSRKETGRHERGGVGEGWCASVPTSHAMKPMRREREAKFIYRQRVKGRRDEWKTHNSKHNDECREEENTHAHNGKTDG